MQVVRGEEHVLPALRRPVLRGVDLRRHGHAGVEAPRACHTVSLIASLRMYVSTTRWLTAWNMAMTRPNCSRSFT